jgi:F0F1-type ATP synthase membrane subunit b/b'
MDHVVPFVPPSPAEFKQRMEWAGDMLREMHRETEKELRAIVLERRRRPTSAKRAERKEIGRQRRRYKAELRQQVRAGDISLELSNELLKARKTSELYDTHPGYIHYARKAREWI